MTRPLLISVALHAAAFVWLYAFFSAHSAFEDAGTSLEIVVSAAGTGALSRSNGARRSSPAASVAAVIASPSASAPEATSADSPANVQVSAIPVSSESENAIATAFSRNHIPEYPRVSRLRGEEGRVVVAATVARNGVLVAPPRTKVSSGFENLDHAALAAVESWSFSPLPESERLELEIPFVFRLEEKR